MQKAKDEGCWSVDGWAELRACRAKLGGSACPWRRQVDSHGLAQKGIFIQGFSWEGNGSAFEWTPIKLTLEKHLALMGCLECVDPVLSPSVHELINPHSRPVRW